MTTTPTPHPNMRVRLLAAGALALALLAGACGASKTATSATTSTSTGASSSSTSTTADAAANPNAPEVSPSGDIPDTQVFVAYTPPSGGFSVKVPEGWSRTGDTGAVTFTDKLNSIRMETVAAASAPTVQSAQQNEEPAIKASSKGYVAGKVSTVTRKAGSAVLITYEADSPPDPVTGKIVHDAVERYEFWKNGKEVILTLSGPKGADNVDPWKIVTDSFVWQ
jgi:hypothetical protein